MLTEKLEVKYIRYMRSHNSGNIHGEICIFERSNEKNHFSRTKIYLDKKTTPQLLGHIGLQNTKVRLKANFGRLTKIFQICAMDADILS